MGEYTNCGDLNVDAVRSTWPCMRSPYHYGIEYVSLIYVLRIPLTAAVSLALSGIVGKLMVARLTAYQKATQDRINFISEILSSMKAVKMLGLTERFTKLAEKKRDSDLDAGKHYRVFIVYLNCIS